MKQTFDRHMSTLFHQPSQTGAAFAGERRFSKSRGLYASVSFLPLPLPPSFIFWLSFHFSRGQNRKSPSSVFLCSETKRKRFYAGYSSIDLHIHQSSDLQIHRSSHPQIYRSPSDLLIHRSSDLQNHRSTKPAI